MPDSGSPSQRLTVEFAGEYFHVLPGTVFEIGRDGDIALDDNPYLHRRFLEFHRREGLWWLSNVGTRLTATLADPVGTMQAWLAPGATMPIVFRATAVVFTAGSTTYEFSVYVDAPQYEPVGGSHGSGDTTIGAVSLTESQREMLVALAERYLRRDGAGMSEIPTSAAAAERLGWSLTKFNRKLDNVCDKLAKVGVRGLKGGTEGYATNRRARLVEHAVASRLVSRADLHLLDRDRMRGDQSDDQ